MVKDPMSPTEEPSTTIRVRNKAEFKVHCSKVERSFQNSDLVTTCTLDIIDYRKNKYGEVKIHTRMKSPYWGYVKQANMSYSIELPIGIPFMETVEKTVKELEKREATLSERMDNKIMGFYSDVQLLRHILIQGQVYDKVEIKGDVATITLTL